MDGRCTSQGRTEVSIVVLVGQSLMRSEMHGRDVETSGGNMR